MSSPKTPPVFSLYLVNRNLAPSRWYGLRNRLIDAGTEMASSKARAPIESCSGVVSKAGRTGGSEGIIELRSEAADGSCERSGGA